MVWMPPCDTLNQRELAGVRNQKLESETSPSGGWNSVRQKFQKLALVPFLAGIFLHNLYGGNNFSFLCSAFLCIQARQLLSGFPKMSRIKTQRCFWFWSTLVYSLISASCVEIGRATSNTQRKNQAGEWRLSQEEMLSFNFHGICIWWLDWMWKTNLNQKTEGWKLARVHFCW